MLTGPKKDLDIAKAEIVKMQETSGFSEFQEYWENYLMRIERAWMFTEIFREEKRFSTMDGSYRILRKKDSLLIFLKQARNAEMHRTSTTINKQLEMAIKDKSGKGFKLDSIAAQLEEGTLTIDLESPDIILNVDVVLVPTNPEVVKFKNRGKWYNPPWHHLKKRITDLHPVCLAELGLSFYRTFVEEAEAWSKNS